MKIKFTILLLCIISVPAMAQDMLKVCTFNIRFANPADGIHQWENRKEHVVNFIKAEAIDIIGMQEVLHSQITYLNEHLPNYTQVGVGREDGKQKGEYVPIYFNSEKFELLDSGNFWLSTTPDKPSVGWDAALPRIVTYAVLKNIKTQEKIHVLNAHYDHVGKIARENSSKLLSERLLGNYPNDQLILLGDFNLEPEEEAIQLITSSGLKDSYLTSEITFGSEGTFNGFEVGKVHGKRIDYIFYKNLKAKVYKVNSSVIDQTYLSDHFPVVVEFR
ncbi:endonuclease/exonuclease/phosphatase family protein [Marivirga sp. S37H4]|uniref:Endonuclease/exonuclease/phosphatase family protein n=1 Tax=Marivirga aurantiaca TaxID=2802615 RepID=A0A934WY66_9BACT|nr:endonuclease/exonuclease/phosphatase family protein [Marivirga aurantiaca]MBK6265057.1 endonuclease/exonuclease/phosphatase family protein [Marivirga aurantiaca]